MTVTLLTVQTLTGSGTAITTTLLSYPAPPVSQKSNRICCKNYKSKCSWAVRGEQMLHLLHTSYATDYSSVLPRSIGGVRPNDCR